MFTNNYWNILSSFALGGGPDKKLIGTNGTEYTLQGKYPVCTPPMVASVLTIGTKYNTSPGCVVFGDGVTPPTVNDYKLAGNIITGISGSRTRQSSIDETGHNNIYTFTVTNSNSTEITIREAGFIQSNNFESRYLSSDSSTSLTQTTLGLGGQVMVNRIVLAEPVTIPANGIGQVTLDLRFDIPTA